MTARKPPAPFIAIDGEAIDGAYVLLARSTGDHVMDLADGGLATATAIEFLLSAPRPSILVCFGLNYDVNQWLRDVPKRALRELWESHYTYWRDYRIEWLPGRWFSVKALDGRYAKVHETFGFFQSSFVRALADWGLDPPDEIAAMKRRRGTFTAADRRRVVEYCLAECGLLVELMDRLRAACTAAEILPRQWIGAGSIATALLGRQGMDRHHAYDLDLADVETVETAVLGAYFGGRVELLSQGVHRHVSTVDLKSAYPAAALRLPSLDGAKLVHRRRFADRPGIWRVRWDLRGAGEQLAPFPVRCNYGIFYPEAGEGHYHSVEVKAAIAAGYPVEILEGWVLYGGDDEPPFSWIADVYRRRQAFERAGHPAQKVVKLGLNSIYGKLAQGYGYGARPRWQSYFWAGQITATTRAAVLDVARRTAAPLMISTDGIFAAGDSPRGLGRRGGLGAWERGRLDLLFAAQPGVYQGMAEGRELLKSRGFFAAEVDYDELREGFEREGAGFVYRYDSTRFVGLGAALARRDFSIWRRWVTETRSLLLHPERKAIVGDRLYPIAGPLISEPYEPKISLLDARAIDYTQGMEQPLREAI